LIPRPEVPGIGSACRDVFPPELGESRFKEPIHDRRNTLAHGLWGNKTAADVEKIFVGESLVAHGDPLQPRPRPEPIQGQQEPILEGSPVEVFPGRRTPKEARKIHAQIGFFEDIEETGHRPPLGDLHLEGEHIGGFGLRSEGGELDPALGLGQNLDIGMAWQGLIQRGEFVAHLLLDLQEGSCDET
jgi:hypothetical protein